MLPGIKKIKSDIGLVGGACSTREVQTTLYTGKQEGNSHLREPVAGLKSVTIEFVFVGFV
jgi:hypothetical protein